MVKEDKDKTLFFPNLYVVEKAIEKKEFEKTITQIQIEWDKIKDATIEALTKETTFTLDVCKSIVSYAIGQCNEDPKVFIEIVEDWEFIITELLNEGLIIQINQNSNSAPF